MADQKPQAVNPLDLPGNREGANVAPSNILRSIVNTESGQNTAKILEQAPEVDSSLLQSIAPPKNFLLLVLKTLFIALIAFSTASYLFFTSQLTDRFDFVTSRLGLPNISSEFAASNTEIITLQTDINLHRYLKAKAYLDEFSYYGDSFVKNFEVKNSQTSSSYEKNEAEKQMVTDRKFMEQAMIKSSNELLAKKFTVTIVDLAAGGQSDLEKLFKDKLKDKLTQNALAVSKSDSPDAKASYLNYVHTANLIGNDKLISLMGKSDIEAMNDNDLYAFVKDMNGLIVNNLSIIQQIKDKRIKWSDIMQEIENKTIAVDKYYSQGSYEQIGGIRYTSYDFDANGPSIAITGETKRFDTINFTIIVGLIDKLNESPFFANGEMRSFTKSGSYEEGYTASLKISLDLEKSAETNAEQK